jgi:hypothetical protein
MTVVRVHGDLDQSKLKTFQIHKRKDQNRMKLSEQLPLLIEKLIYSSI